MLDDKHLQEIKKRPVGWFRKQDKDYLISTIEGLKGEVERLKIATSIDVSLGNTVCEMQAEIERYRKALEAAGIPENIINDIGKS